MRTNFKKSVLLISALAAFSMFSLATPLSAQTTVTQVTQAGEKRADDGAAEQTRVEQVADQTEALLASYKTELKVVDGLKVYNSLLQRQIDNQMAEKTALSESIDSVALIERQIVPMMTSMIDSLEDFIELDTPFLLKERQDRMARLREMMERSDVTAAEKFRRVIEAYQIENDYGRTIEAYKGTVEVDGNQQEVDFLRIGRVSLSYQSIGGQHTGAWDTNTRAFVAVPPETYKANVSQGIRVARKQVAPDLLTIPVPAATGDTL
jgi:TolA-binding protein